MPYIAPQEHGHHGDARRLRLTREDGTGIEVRGMPTIGFSASHFTARTSPPPAIRATCSRAPR